VILFSNSSSSAKNSFNPKSTIRGKRITGQKTRSEDEAKLLSEVSIELELLANLENCFLNHQGVSEK
jgi:hypothetical protein